MLSILAGFWLGLVHVLIGPDHLAAIAPMAVDDRRPAWRLGLRWGLGHSGGVLIIGIAVLSVREIVPVDLISSYSERAVGVVLVAIGIWAIRRAFDRRIHTHTHEHEGHAHEHFHVHAAPKPHTRRAHAHGHAGLAVGALHGLAGSAHLLGILPALALPSTLLTVLCILSFGVGTVAGMLVFSCTLGWIAKRFAAARLVVYRGMMLVCAGVAIVTGGMWMWLT
ncbi:MAG: sulfite exporter TauE/SafE family protein [candidate division Zixibacteria bacterium]|nr:sulfite exporter TauE/SafE family protein [candidate division Zixibacteria bacterium]